MWLVSFYGAGLQRLDLNRFLLRSHAIQNAEQLQKLTGGRGRYVVSFEMPGGEG